SPNSRSAAAKSWSTPSPVSWRSASAYCAAESPVAARSWRSAMSAEVAIRGGSTAGGGGKPALGLRGLPACGRSDKKRPPFGSESQPMSLLDRVRYCQQRRLADYCRFVVAGDPVGWVRNALAERIAGAAVGFHLSPGVLALAPSPDNFAERTQVMRTLLRRFDREGLVTGWRDEDYPVAVAYGRPPLLRLERAGAPLFGVQGYGVHLNGHVGRGDELRLWVGR